MIVIKIKYLIERRVSINLIMIVIKKYVIFMTDLKIEAAISADEPIQKRKRGRPKCFNEQETLQKAMLLFWEFGYEATSMSDLTQRLNLSAPSLYSAFGDKSQFFQRCLAYYLEHEACPIDLIFKQAKTAKVAIELYLYETLKRLLQLNKPTGCMLVTATINCSQEHAPLQQDLLEKRQMTKETILRRLQQGVREGDLSAKVDVYALTDYYTTLIQGLTMQARDGLNHQQLSQVIRLALKTWDSFSSMN